MWFVPVDRIRPFILNGAEPQAERSLRIHILYVSSAGFGFLVILICSTRLRATLSTVTCRSP